MHEIGELQVGSYDDLKQKFDSSLTNDEQAPVIHMFDKKYQSDVIKQFSAQIEDIALDNFVESDYESTSYIAHEEHDVFLGMLPHMFAKLGGLDSLYVHNSVIISAIRESFSTLESIRFDGNKADLCASIKFCMLRNE
ncbi:hypothetical protein RND81_07G032100 [Saponaria officinalis]|uniref:Uncharacterized protein n=1 Tax=Saponaria officinalis TaxID=3572 RepID=A0AAW1JLL7_SAPOF